MVQCRSRSCLLLETPQSVGISGEERRQDLNRHVAPESQITSAIHLAHTT